MTYKDFEMAFSSARLSKYSNACNGDIVSALSLYRYNVKLCQKFYGILNIFEVALRNAINNHYAALYSDRDWIKNQMRCGGMLESHPQRTIVEKTIEQLCATGSYSNDRVVSSVSLGFWTYLFTKMPFKRGGKSILKVFPGKVRGIGQRAIYNELQAIKNFRNRIAHHEPICFNQIGERSTKTAVYYYNLIIKYVRFLGYSERQLYYGLNVLPDSIIRKINSL